MSQSETPEIKAETQPTTETTQGDAVKRSKLPDFRPLGTVRDYFTELMKQDSIR
jgi:hypothetical protein